MTKTLLIGHRGLVGSALTDIINPFVLNGRVNDYEFFKSFLEKNEIKRVVHAAAKVGGVKDNIENRLEFFLENSKINNIVFEACFSVGVETFVNFSSTCVFPAEADYPLTEEQVYNGIPHFSNDGYAYAKRMMQFMCERAHERGFNYFTLIPTNVFGPNDNFNLQSGHVIPSLIHKCYIAQKNKTDFIIGGTGKSLREFIFSKDLAAITSLLIEKKIPQKSIIISDSREISINDCAYTVAKLMNYKGVIRNDLSFPDGLHRKNTNTALLNSILPDFKFTPFEDALLETIDWFLKNVESQSIRL